MIQSLLVIILLHAAIVIIGGFHSRAFPSPLSIKNRHYTTFLHSLSEAYSQASTHQQTTSCYLAQTNVTLQFPSYWDLMDCAVGEFITSDPFYCGNAKFCVKLYPRGGGHRASSTTSTTSPTSSEQGFGMSYQILPMFSNPNDLRNQKVGIYLQYLGPEPTTVDATFAFRLQGNQRVGRKFDLQWRAGMRFVPPDQPTDVSKGCANDFGAHLMQTPLLEEFMGVADETPANENINTPLVAHVQVTLHDSIQELMNQGTIVTAENDTTEQDQVTSFFGALGNDIRIPPGLANKDQRHDGTRVRVGKIVVPILSKLSERPRMFQQGTYPGVEYRILRILDPQTGQERFTSCPGCDYELKPIYPLVAQLERPWPVRVKETEIPRLYTPTMYNAVSAVGSLLTAMTALATAFLVSQAISFFFIPSRSMDPTLQVGDVLLVDKISPRIFKNQKPGDIVLFSPPQELRDIVAANGGKLTSRDLFVKRIAAQGGDSISVNRQGNVLINGQPAPGRRDLCQAEPLRLIEKYIKPKTDETVPRGDFFVMGDCSSVSIDSRVWGPLQSSDIVGKPILRLWPLARFGTLPSLQPLSTATETWTD